MCKGGSSGGGGSTTVSSSQLDPTVSAAYQDLINQAKAIAGPDAQYQQYTGQTVAGLTPSQLQAMGGINAAQGMAQPYYNTAAGLASSGATPLTPTAFSGSEVQKYMDPYLGSVVDSTRANLNANNQIQQQQLLGSAISSGASPFGGDRAGVAAAELARQQNLSDNQTISNLYSQGYGQALGEFNTQQQVGLAAGQQNAANQLNAAQLYGGLGTSAQGSALQGLAAQLQSGTLEQQQNQAQLSNDYNQWLEKTYFPFQTTSYLANIVQGLGNQFGGTSSQTTSQQGGSGLGQAAGLATAGIGILGATGAFGSGGWLGFKRGGRLHRASGGEAQYLVNDPDQMRYLENDPAYPNPNATWRPGDPVAYPMPTPATPPPQLQIDADGNFIVDGMRRGGLARAHRMDGGGFANVNGIDTYNNAFADAFANYGNSMRDELASPDRMESTLTAQFMANGASYEDAAAMAADAIRNQSQPIDMSADSDGVFREHYGGGGGTINGAGGSGNVSGGGRGNAGGGGKGNTGKGEQSRVNDKAGTQQQSWGNRATTDYGAPVHPGKYGDVAQSPTSWAAQSEQVNAYNAAAHNWNNGAGRSLANMVNNSEPFGFAMQAPDFTRPNTYVGGDYHLSVNPLGLAGSLASIATGVPGLGNIGGKAYEAFGGKNVMLGGGDVPGGWQSGLAGGMGSGIGGDQPSGLSGDPGAGGPGGTRTAPGTNIIANPTGGPGAVIAPVSATMPPAGSPAATPPPPQGLPFANPGHTIPQYGGLAFSPTPISGVNFPTFSPDQFSAHMASGGSADDPRLDYLVDRDLYGPPLAFDTENSGFDGQGFALDPMSDVDPDEADPAPYWDTSGGTAIVSYPSNGESIDTGLPIAAAGQGLATADDASMLSSPWWALLNGGLAMAASKNPDIAGQIGEGGLAGLQAFATGQQYDQQQALKRAEFAQKQKVADATTQWRGSQVQEQNRKNSLAQQQQAAFDQFVTTLPADQQDAARAMGPAGYSDVLKQKFGLPYEVEKAQALAGVSTQQAVDQARALLPIELQKSLGIAQGQAGIDLQKAAAMAPIQTAQAVAQAQAMLPLEVQKSLGIAQAMLPVEIQKAQALAGVNTAQAVDQAAKLAPIQTAQAADQAAAVSPITTQTAANTAAAVAPINTQQAADQAAAVSPIKIAETNATRLPDLVTMSSPEGAFESVDKTTPEGRARVAELIKLGWIERSGADPNSKKFSEDQNKSRQLLMELLPNDQMKTEGDYSIAMKNFGALENTLSQLGDNVPTQVARNWLTSSEYQQGKNAIAHIIRNNLYSLSGAAITEPEAQRAAALLMPSIGESAASIADKKARIQGFVDGIKQRAGAAGADLSLPDFSAQSGAPSAGPKEGQIIRQNGQTFKIVNGQAVPQ